MDVICAVVDTPWGRAFLGYHYKYICYVEYSDLPLSIDDIKEHIEMRWPTVRAVPTTRPELDHIFDAPVLMFGTDFQRRVWKELLRIPRGRTATYGEIATNIGNPGSARAVGQAVAANPVAVRVPCHRVLPAGGGIGGYRWGVALKKRLLADEGIQP